MTIKLIDEEGLEITFDTLHDVSVERNGIAEAYYIYNCKEWIITDVTEGFLQKLPSLTKESDKDNQEDKIKRAIKQLRSAAMEAIATETKLAYGHALSVLERMLKDEG